VFKEKIGASRMISTGCCENSIIFYAMHTDVLNTIASYRTGMLVMLLQSLLGVSDDEIIDDYFRSNESFQKKKDSSSAGAAATKGKLDRSIFSGTNRQAMITTLEFLRSKYGSVSPGYLDDIGFDDDWRRRLVAVLTQQPRSGNADFATDPLNSESSLPRSRL
jgi:Tyrosine phosphatase family